MQEEHRGDQERAHGEATGSSAAEAAVQRLAAKLSEETPATVDLVAPDKFKYFPYTINPASHFFLHFSPTCSFY